MNLNSKFPDGLSRTDAIAMYMISKMKELEDNGLIENDIIIRMTSRCEIVMEELRRINFKPTKEEQNAFLIEMTDQPEAIMLLI